MIDQARVLIEVTVVKGDGGWADKATVTADADGIYMDFSEQPMHDFRLCINAEQLRDLVSLVEFLSINGEKS